MKISVYNKQRNLKISSQAVKKLVSAVMDNEDRFCDEVSIHFVSTKEISKLHAEFFDDPSTTDCISFPMDDEDFDFGYKLLGDVFVCPQTAIDYVKKHGGDYYEETSLYIIHGLLHLFGYDDLEPKKKVVMRRAEKKHLLQLKKQSLLLKSP